MLSLIRHDMFGLWNNGVARVGPSHDGDFDLAEGGRADVRGLAGVGGQPVTVDDAWVGDDGSGNAMLLLSSG